MNNPIKLVIDEPAPGSFVWTLLETDTSGTARKVVRAAEYGADTYEAALAAGTRVLDSEMRKSSTSHRQEKVSG